MAKKQTIISSGGLEEFLKETASTTWKKYHNNRTCWDAYCGIKQNLQQIQESVEEGAMAEGIKSVFGQCKSEIERLSSESEENISDRIHEFLAADPVIFLNDHGPAHMDKVIERANSIILNFKEDLLTEFETFILLCAIQIHDIGNILGRAGHERKLHEIFDDHSKDIIIDTPERRVIKSIAMAHGGKSNSGKDTITQLSTCETIFDSCVRTRLLAAILRFADELADDLTRAKRAVLDLDIIGTNSRIYHDYSRSLHTVKIEKDNENRDYKIVLIYELEAKALETKYKVGSYDKYLLDEIYDRTLKMEQERRYCMKFMYPYVNIGRIDVTINVYGALSQKLNTISYRIEDISYPDDPRMGSIKTVVRKKIPSGEEELEIIKSRGELQ